MPRNWEKIKSDFQRLYKDEDKTLEEVMKFIKQKHGFQASERSYKSQLRRWGLMKNIKDSHRKLGSQTKDGNRYVGASGLAPSPIRFTTTDADTPMDMLPDMSLGHFEDFTSQTTNTKPQQHPLSWTFMEATENRSNSTSNQDPQVMLNFPGDDLSPTANTQSLDTVDSAGRTQLHRATINGSEKEIHALLHQGAPVDIRDQLGYEPLHYAVLNGDAGLIRLLLKFGANADSKAYMDRTPLHLAVPRKASMEALLQADCKVNAQDKKGNTPLHLLLATPCLDGSFDESIRLLINAGADINITNNNGNSSFHLLINQAHPDKSPHVYENIQFFFKNGADIFLRSSDGKFPFEIFLHRSQEAWVRDTDDTAGNHLNMSAHACFLAFVNSGADINVKVRSGELLALDYLQNYSGQDHFSQRAATIQLLAEKVTLDKLGKSGNYFIHELLQSATTHAWGTSSGDYLRILFTRGANPNLQNLQGQSPIMALLAVKQSLNDIKANAETLNLLRILLEWGACPWIRDNEGNLPIYEGVRNFPTEAHTIAKMLLFADGEGVELRHRDDSAAARYDSSWWKAWDLAIADDDWKERGQQLHTARSSLPNDIRASLHTIMMRILADSYLEKAKKRFQLDETGLSDHRRYVFVILRDMGKMEMRINSSWFDYFLKICEEVFFLPHRSLFP